MSLWRHLTSFLDVADTIAWGQPIVSPVNGVVVECESSVADRTAICMSYDLFKLLLNKPKESDGFGAFGGNYVVIETAGVNETVYVLMCHMQQDSVKVKVGDQVTVGQEVGCVGNSGSSIQPHLHLQVMKDMAIFPLFGNLLPFTIRQGQIKQAGQFETIEDFGLQNKTHYRF